MATYAGDDGTGGKEIGVGRLIPPAAKNRSPGDTSDSLSGGYGFVPLSPLRRTIGHLYGSLWGDVLLLAILVAMVAVVHLVVPGTVPSGPDGGNWLALAQEQRGVDVMSADVRYPPLFTGLLSLLLLLGIPKIGALISMALLAKAALVTATYMTARTLSRTYAAAASLLMIAVGAQLEAYAWGGYPQLLATAFGLVAVFLIVRYVDTQRRPHLWFGLAFAAATLITHVMIGGLLALALAVAILHWLYAVDPGKRVWRRGVRLGAAVAGGTAVGALFVLLYWRGLGTEAILNPLATARWESLTHVVRHAPLPWAIVSVSAVGVLFLRSWPAHVGATLALGSGWLAAGVAFFLATGEWRGLLVSQVGLVLLATLGFGVALDAAAGSQKGRYTLANPRSVPHRLLLIVGVSVFVSIAVAGLGSYPDTIEFFRVVDQPEIAALDQLSHDADLGSVVVAARGNNGHPIGWWIEGYAGLPTWTGLDLIWLAFPDEREQAEVANSFFLGDLSEADSVAVLREIGADYLVVDQRGPDAEWLEGEFARSLPVVDDSSHLIILEARPRD